MRIVTMGILIEFVCKSEYYNIFAKKSCKNISMRTLLFCIFTP